MGSVALDLGPDTRLFLWTLGWDVHAFSTAPLDIFDANIFHPEPRTLAYSEHQIGSALFAAPLVWGTGNLVLAMNAVLLLSCFLSGWFAYVLGPRARAFPVELDSGRRDVCPQPAAILPHRTASPRDGAMDTPLSRASSSLRARRNASAPSRSGARLLAPGSLRRADGALPRSRRGGASSPISGSSASFGQRALRGATRYRRSR